jgi:hypothetical protein
MLIEQSNILYKTIEENIDIFQIYNSEIILENEIKNNILKSFKNIN